MGHGASLCTLVSSHAPHPSAATSSRTVDGCTGGLASRSVGSVDAVSCSVRAWASPSVWVGYAVAAMAGSYSTPASHAGARTGCWLRRRSNAATAHRPARALRRLSNSGPSSSVVAISAVSSFSAPSSPYSETHNDWAAGQRIKEKAYGAPASNDSLATVTHSNSRTSG